MAEKEKSTEQVALERLLSRALMGRKLDGTLVWDELAPEFNALLALVNAAEVSLEGVDFQVVIESFGEPAARALFSALYLGAVFEDAIGADRQERREGLGRRQGDDEVPWTDGTDPATHS